MSELKLIKTRLAEGVWQGLLQGAPEGVVPRLQAHHDGTPVEGLALTPGEASTDWQVRIPVPIEAVGDGVHVITIREADSGTTLGSFAILAGEVMADSLQAEVALLREELDTLKRAFRHHCSTT